mgnify:CR=1 FL=1
MYAGFEQSFVERMARQEEVLLGQALKGTGAGGLDLVAVELHGHTVDAGQDLRRPGLEVQAREGGAAGAQARDVALGRLVGDDALAVWAAAEGGESGAVDASGNVTTYCSGDGTAGLCPCGNPGGPGRGCAVILTGDYHFSDIKVVRPGAARPYAEALADIVKTLYAPELAERYPLLRQPERPRRA